MSITACQTIDDYISTFPEAVQIILREVRNTIQKAEPEASEAISYGIPTFKLQGKNLVHFAAFKNHIGFYPTPNGMDSFQEALSNFKQGKGSVQFPLNKPMPWGLIKEITTFRAKKIAQKLKK